MFELRGVSIMCGIRREFLLMSHQADIEEPDEDFEETDPTSEFDLGDELL